MWVFVFNSLQKEKKKRMSYQLSPVPFLSVQNWFPCVSWLQAHPSLLCSVALGLGSASIVPSPLGIWLLFISASGRLEGTVGRRDSRALCWDCGHHTSTVNHPQRHWQSQGLSPGCLEALHRLCPRRFQHQPTGTPLSSSELHQPREHTASVAIASESAHLPLSAASASQHPGNHLHASFPLITVPGSRWCLAATIFMQVLTLSVPTLSILSLICLSGLQGAHPPSPPARVQLTVFPPLPLSLMLHRPTHFNSIRASLAKMHSPGIAA